VRQTPSSLSVQRLPDLVIWRILTHIGRLSTALNFVRVCRHIYVSAYRAESHWKYRYKTCFKLEERVEEANWLYWQFERRKTNTHHEKQLVNPLPWFIRLCRRGALEANWRNGRWNVGGVRVKAQPTQVTKTTSSEMVQKNKQEASFAIASPPLRLVTYDYRFVLIADNIRGRLLLLEPKTPVQSIGCQMPPDWTSVWPPQSFSVALGDDYIVIGIDEAQVQGSSAGSGKVYVWSIDHGKLVRYWSVVWSKPNVSMVGHWLLVQAAAPDYNETDAYGITQVNEETLTMDETQEELNYSLAYDISGLAQDNVLLDGSAPDHVVELRWSPRLAPPCGRTHYRLLLSAHKDVVKAIAYRIRENIVYWAVITNSYQSDLKSDKTELDTIGATSKQTATQVLNNGWFEADLPLRDDMECIPLFKQSVHMPLTSEPKDPNVLLVGSYSQTATQQYFFIGTGSEDEEDSGEEDGGGAAESLTEHAPDTSTMKDGIEQTVLNDHADAASSSTQQRRKRRSRRLHMMEPTWIAIHSLQTGELLWQRVIRGECRGRLLPIPSRDALMCSFTRGAMLMNLRDGTNLRIYRAAGARLAPGPQHAIGRQCAIWAANGESVFYIDVQNERVPRRPVPAAWLNSLRAMTSKKEQGIDSKVTSKPQLAIGSSFLVMILDDTVRWLYFGADVEQSHVKAQNRR
jgi:hypothetical protein